MFRRTGVNIQVEVVWALSRAVICNLSICPSKTIKELKITISEHAKVPACFMDLICEDKVALDTHQLRVFGDGELEIQVLRKKPAELLSIIRGRYMKDWYMLEHDFQFSAVVRSDLPMLEYIIATDDDGDLVNEKDEMWPPESEQPEDWLTQEEQEHRTIHRNCTALHYAALLRDVHLCKLILDHPRFQEANAHCKLPYRGYNEGGTALHIACAIGIQDICLLLLQQPKFTAVWDRDADNRTALHYAMEGGHPEVISAFLEHFKDDVKSHTYTLEVLVDCCIHELFYVESANHREMVKLVVQSCAAALSSLPPMAIDWLMQPSNRKIFQDALKEQKDCGKLLAGLHLGNGHLDLELAMFPCDLNKDELAHRRRVKQRERRRRFLSAKAKKNTENTGRIWKSKASRIGFASKNTTSFQWPSGICLSNS